MRWVRYAIGRWYPTLGAFSMLMSSQFGMSALTMGMAVDFEREGRSEMAITSLWPAAVRIVSRKSLHTADQIKAIDSAATQNPQTDRSQLRKPTIFSDAILAILKSPTKDVNGRCLLDEDFMREHEGVSDFSKYALVEGTTPRRIMPAEFPDLSVKEQDDEGRKMVSLYEHWICIIHSPCESPILRHVMLTSRSGFRITRCTQAMIRLVF